MPVVPVWSMVTDPVNVELVMFICDDEGTNPTMPPAKRWLASPSRLAVMLPGGVYVVERQGAAVGQAAYEYTSFGDSRLTVAGYDLHVAYRGVARGSGEYASLSRCRCGGGRDVDRVAVAVDRAAEIGYVRYLGEGEVGRQYVIAVGDVGEGLLVGYGGGLREVGGIELQCVACGACEL